LDACPFPAINQIKLPTPGSGELHFRDGEGTKKRETRSWAVYQVKGTPAKLVAIVDAPNAEIAIARAIDQENVPPNEGGRLIAQRRD
jgi:hypothetical protein